MDRWLLVMRPLAVVIARGRRDGAPRFTIRPPGSLAEKLRKTDLLVCYGGEEFAVLLPDGGLEDAKAIADRLLPAQPEGTCSSGLAAWDGAETELELVARADKALYAAKEGGRNRWCASPPPSERAEPVAVSKSSERG